MKERRTGLDRRSGVDRRSGMDRRAYAAAGYYTPQRQELDRRRAERRKGDRRDAVSAARA